MFIQLLTILTFSLLFLAVGNIKQSTYGKIAFSVSERWKESRSIVNVLNWFQRNFAKIKAEKIIPKLEEDAKSKSKEENDKARHEGYAVTRMVQFLLGNSFANMIELWNPKDESKKRLLGERHVSKLEKGRETNFKKGGISPFQLSQVAIAIGQELIKRHGNAFGTIVEDDNSDNIKLRTSEGIINLNEYRAGEPNECTTAFVDELFEIAESYNAEKDANWKETQKAKQAEKAGKETESETVEKDKKQESEFTVDDYLNGEFSPNDTENVDLLSQFREDERVTGGKKGVLTRRINELTS